VAFSWFVCAFMLCGLLCFVIYESVQSGQLQAIFQLIFILDNFKIEPM